MRFSRFIGTPMVVWATAGCGIVQSDSENDDWWGNDTAPEPDASDFVGGETNERNECTDPPEVDLEEVQGSQPRGADVMVSSYVYLDAECPTITLVGIQLFYQQSTAGSGSWESVSMIPGQNPNEWRGAIPSYALGSAYMRYFVVASDTAGNVTVEPDGANVDPSNANTFNVSTE